MHSLFSQFTILKYTIFYYTFIFLNNAHLISNIHLSLRLSQFFFFLHFCKNVRAPQQLYLEKGYFFNFLQFSPQNPPVTTYLVVKKRKKIEGMTR
ncbi:unnamed protein product [Meloidogyne enterolobii]|uniref:Uncharacterized protein n=1 Tax=Meloidogyne enterolobii TaxID=390850 RepID=A0ACB0XKS1_MELEN